MQKKEKILFMDLIAKIFTVAGLYCLGSLTGAYIMCMIFVMNVVCYFKERKNWKLPVLYFLFEIVFIAILFYTYDGLSSILVFTCSSLTLFANWWLSPQYMRITAVWGCVIYLAYQISIKNWAGLLEIGAFASNLISYLKYRKSPVPEK